MKKFSKKYVYYRLVSYLLYVFIGFQFFFGSFLGERTDENGNSIPLDEFKSMLLFFVVVAFIVWLFLCLYGYLYYQSSGYELTDKEIICQRGVLFKKKSVIEYQKIHAVNQKHGLIQRMFGISTLLIDSGSTNTAMNAEIIIFEDVDVVNDLYHRLKNIDEQAKQDDDLKLVAKVPEEYLFNFTSKNKLLYSAINVIGSLIVMLVAGLLIYLILGAINYFVVDAEKIDLLMVLAIMVGFYFVINLIIFIAMTLYSFVSLYDFKVTKEANSLNINYGLFVRTNNTFKLNRIKGVRIEQDLIKRILGFATIKLEVIGYNHVTNDENNNGSQNLGLLIPLCKLSEVNDYLAKMLPDYIPCRQQEKAKSFKAFIAMPILITSICLGLFTIALIPFLVLFNNLEVIIFGLIGLVLIYLMIIGGYILRAILAYPNQDVVVDDAQITIYHGSLTKRITVIRQENLIAIEDITTYYRALKGIYSYRIHFHTNALSNVIEVKMLNLETKNKLISLLKY